MASVENSSGCARYSVRSLVRVDATPARISALSDAAPASAARMTAISGSTGLAFGRADTTGLSSAKLRPRLPEPRRPVQILIPGPRDGVSHRPGRTRAWRQAAEYP